MFAKPMLFLDDFLKSCRCHKANPRGKHSWIDIITSSNGNNWNQENRSALAVLVNGCQ